MKQLTWSDCLRLEPALGHVVLALQQSIGNGWGGYLDWLQGSLVGRRLMGVDANRAALRNPEVTEMVWATLKYLEYELRAGHGLPGWAKVERPKVEVHFEPVTWQPREREATF